MEAAAGVIELLSDSDDNIATIKAEPLSSMIPISSKHPTLASFNIFFYLVVVSNIMKASTVVALIGILLTPEKCFA